MDEKRVRGEEGVVSKVHQSKMRLVISGKGGRKKTLTNFPRGRIAHISAA